MTTKRRTVTVTVKVKVVVDLDNYSESYGEEPTRENITDWVTGIVEGVLSNDGALIENEATINVK